MKTLDGREIKGIPRDLAAKVAYMEIALKYLAENKGFILHIDSCNEDANTLCPYLHGMTCGDASFSYNISDVIFNDDPTFHGAEPHFNDWAYEKRLVLRLAKLFFEGYKTWKEEQQSISIAANKVTLGNAVYDICSSKVDTLSSTIDTAEQRINELESRNEQLEKEVQELKAMKDVMWSIMQQKGLI